MKDLYEKFAYDYDEFGAIEDYLGSESEFLGKLFVKHGVKTVLDCACGTGQHLYMLSEMGFDVSGSDYSESMIAVADKNLKSYGKIVPLCQCDFRYLEQKYAQTFDAIVCLTTALPPVEVVINRADFSRVFIKEQDNQFQTIHVLDLFHSSERNESSQYDIIYKIILDDEYRALLSKAGFKNIQIYGDYEDGDYNEKSRRLIVVAQ